MTAERRRPTYIDSELRRLFDEPERLRGRRSTWDELLGGEEHGDTGEVQS